MRLFHFLTRGVLLRALAAFLTALLLTTNAATAQTYPERLLPGLNDYADIVDPETEVRIADAIADIFQSEDVDIAIATLSSVRFYAQDASIEDYATGLFNAWALGDADENDGILILVFRDDREVRIELGTGYGPDANETAQRIIGADILPSFREANYSAGIEAGVIGLRDKLIAPPATPTAPSTGDEEPSSSNALYYIGAAIVAAIAGIIGLNKRNAAKLAATPCTSCGKTGLTRSREVITQATEESEGQGETRLTCAACGHVDATPYTISKLDPAIPEGGGSSKGDGATGKW